MTTSFSLNATVFDYAQIRRNSYFESILAICVNVYHTIINSTIKLDNDENTIRDAFLKYLQSIEYKKKYKLKHLKFDKETAENKGRADIRVLPTKNEYVDDEEYYLIECKRLDSKKLLSKYGLNAEYVKNGICRFVSGYYSSHYGCGAMFGFLTESIDVQSDIISNINSMLNMDFINDHNQVVTAGVVKPLSYEDFANGYPYSFLSTHTHTSSKELILYHLMFDFSNIIMKMN